MPNMDHYPSRKYKLSHIASTQTTALLTDWIIKLTHAPYSSDLAPPNGFYLLAPMKKNYVGNDFRRSKKRLMRLVCIFWRDHNRSGKSASKMSLNAYKKYWPWWRIFWKMMKQFSIINLCFFIIRPENIYNYLCTRCSFWPEVYMMKFLS